VAGRARRVGAFGAHSASHEHGPGGLRFGHRDWCVRGRQIGTFTPIHGHPRCERGWLPVSRRMARAGRRGCRIFGSRQSPTAAPSSRGPKRGHFPVHFSFWRNREGQGATDSWGSRKVSVTLAAPSARVPSGLEKPPNMMDIHRKWPLFGPRDDGAGVGDCRDPKVRHPRRPALVMRRDTCNHPRSPRGSP